MTDEIPSNLSAAILNESTGENTEAPVAKHQEDAASGSPPAGDEREQAFNAFRRWGYLQADLDWLERLSPQAQADLDELSGPAADEARGLYCGTLAVEFMHMPDRERRRWVAERMEGERNEVDSSWVLERLVRAETFEEVLQRRYIGNKRFSLEGVAALIPLLDTLVTRGAELGTKKALIGMSHRGRLNVMLHIVGTPAVDIFADFEEVDPRSVLGGGDVKYHLGATGTYHTDDDREVKVHLVSNPSHLEAVDSVLMGRARANQTRLREGLPIDGEAAPSDGSVERQVLPILLHGDAAFAGQGIAAEALNLETINGFSIGGTIHVVVDNMIGFTAEPPALYSSRFATDVAKRLSIPIFHVNGEDPDAVVRAARMVIDYRNEFGSDVVLDLIGYRLHGHSEIDDPTITQPLLYAKIKERPPLWRAYAEAEDLDIGAAEELQKRVKNELDEAKEKAEGLEKKPALHRLPKFWGPFSGGRYKPEYEVETGLSEEEIADLGERLTTVPEDFHIHPKVAKLLEQRAAMARGEHPIDYGMAEALAFGSLLIGQTPIRMSGQDSRRGTFNQRHAVWIDTEDASEYTPFTHLGNEQARFEIHDSMLSEAAVMGFEYGYSRDYPEALVIWEAQFGDFANGAQVILDQFVSAAEDKWDLLSGLVLLLPHGYEGQGPEHSSARIERYLQLAAEDAIQVAQPSTAAQYFHLLRRQALRPWRKPLVVFTPKSMLRAKVASSDRSALTRDRFLPVIPERELESASRILIGTGKIVHELRAEREKRGDRQTAILALEQLYPFPDEALGTELDRFRDARDIIWVQEEPANMGALAFVMPRLEPISRGRHLRSVKRSASASPATGSAKAHQLEQKTLLTLAFTVRDAK
ncbi:MAG TPA: 2-oxoglutarate dehydrogenase E1 component [Thermoanaerobaculia bacterium]|nr:2-oxoglutarate dehydrogenase E1 component [Thermoanaerobaculia bacterium]